MNDYTKAVDLIAQYFYEITPHIWREGEFPTMENKYEYALKILQSHQDYAGKNPEVTVRHRTSPL